MVRKQARFLFILALTAFMAFATIGAAHAAKGGNAGRTGGGGGGGKGGSTTASGNLSLRMVLDQNADGAPNWNDQVTFDVTASVSMPMVNLTCNQGTTQVDNQSIGFYAGWPWSRDFTLSHWYYWPSGGADCTATLYYTGTKGDVTLKTISFRVND